MVALADADPDLAALFDGSAYGPKAIDPSEPNASGDIVPEWVKPLFSAPVTPDEYPALLERAPLDIRVNRLVASPEQVQARLLEAQQIEGCTDGLRLPTGFAIEAEPVYLSGAVEVQDFGSQLIAELCEAKLGMTVLDLCAGAGGKTLALASHMAGEGRLIAADTSRDRLAQLPSRAVRAKAEFIETRLLNPGKELATLDELSGECDIVLIDAPCSGSGTWRRNPETRWRLEQRDLQRLVTEQARLLDIAAQLVKPGGYLVYAVCSLFACEGKTQIDGFMSRTPAFETDDLRGTVGRRDGAGILLTPAHDGSDGFYMARLHKL
jgi:16S rRNA (cytosine967-C5)-methyltransferase